MYLSRKTFDEIPGIVFGSTMLLAAVLSLALPETLGAPFIESLDEIYILQKHSKPFMNWWSVEQVQAHIEKISLLSQTRKKHRHQAAKKFEKV